MKRLFYIIVFPLLFLSGKLLLAQTAPTNDNCDKPVNLRTVSGYCSQPAEFNNIGATNDGLGKASEWPAAGKDVWFKFVATAFDVNINVKSGDGLGTLNSPLIAIYTTSDCINFDQIIGQFFPGTNQSAYYKGALTVGQTYYIRVSAANDNMGTFQLCVDNYFPPTKPGQDFTNASLLCSKDAFTQTNVTGAGVDNAESRGTCLDLNARGSIEANTAWYKWIAANNGTLTFNIIPTNVNDDLDWVLYDLGPISNPKPINATNAIRCAAGSGVACTPKYYITGINSSSSDLNELGGCPSGQDGFVRFVDMQQDHLYALLINNFSTGNNGFRLEFGGTGEFQGPQPTFKTDNTFCDTNFSTTFTSDETRAGYTYEWDFGEGSLTRNSNNAGPITVNYNGPGERIITLKVTSPLGCASYRSYAFADTGPLPTPLLKTIPKTYCVGDVLVLTPINKPPGAEVIFTTPSGEEVIADVFTLTLSSDSLSGLYGMRYTSENCMGESNSIQINVLKRPIANFSINPNVDQLFSAPITFNFNNTSQNATSYLWNFGDGTTSNQENPSHTYNISGRYLISLVVSNQQCTDTLILPVLKILSEGEILVPNTFTPNGDGNNDRFNVLIANLQTYHIDIYNRYGTVVFSSNSILDSWDGSYKGKMMPVGVYYFIINGIDVSGNKLLEKNSVTLIR